MNPRGSEETLHGRRRGRLAGAVLGIETADGQNICMEGGGMREKNKNRPAKRTLVELMLLAVLLAGMPALAQEASDEVLQRFITIGSDDKFDDIQAGCMARTSGWGGLLQVAGTGNVEQYSVGATTWLARVALEARAAAEKLLPEPPIEDMRLMETERLFVVSISPVALNMTGAALLKDIEHVESLWSVV